VRLDRILANLGYATRARARRMVRDGLVAVDGEVVRDPARHADPGTVTLDGLPLEAPHGLFVALNKPVGYVCSHDDRDGRRVWDLLPPRWLERNPRPTTVGRLDKDSSGLLLVTDLHPLVHELTSPRRHVTKRYVVTLERDVDLAEASELVASFASGTLVLRGDDTPCRPAVLAPLGGRAFELTLTEGRHRQVRRMFAASGHEVVALERVAVGPYELGDLAPGEWRAEDPALVKAGSPR
jgi:16S rRNA pseudouridine516 synthase